MMIKTVNLQKIFRTEEVQTLALSNVNIEVNEGEFVAVMGPSGCGKSTLLNILGLLDNPTSGEYYLNGKEEDYSQDTVPDIREESEYNVPRPCHGEAQEPSRNPVLYGNRHRHRAGYANAHPS